MGVLSTFKHDSTMAVRLLTKQKAFTLVAATTLALGIGANSAIFSVVYGVLLRPLGMEDAPSLAVVTLHRNNYPGDVSGFYPKYLDELSGMLEGQDPFGAFTSYLYDSVTLEQGDTVVEIGSTLMVDADFFDVMGVRPILGRTFASDDIVPRQRGVVCVLSEALWQRAFGGDPGIIGREIMLDERAVTVVGVIPAHLPLPDAGTELWIPQDWDLEDRSLLGRIAVFLRLTDTGSFTVAETQLAETASFLGPNYGRMEDYTITLSPFRENLVGNVRPAIILAAAAVGLILLIACANTANLTLARAAMRGEEIATRRALGAKWTQLASQLLTESVALSALGGLLGLGLAFAFHRALLEVVPAYLPRLTDVRLDAPVLVFTLGVSVATGLLFGLAPLAHLSNRKPGSASRGSSTRHTGRRGWLADGLVVSQLALSVMLLVAAALMVRSLSELRGQELGFDPEGVAGARIFLDESTYSDDALEGAYFRELLGRLESHPQIDSVGASSGLPLDPVTIDYDLPYAIPGHESPPDEVRQAFFRTVTPGYLETMRIGLKSGRTFDSGDRVDTLKVAMVNETFAALGWPGVDPVGRSFSIYDGRQELQVVGVVGDVHFRSPGSSYKAEFFVPHSQFTYGAMTVVARSYDPSRAAQLIAAEAVALNRRQPVNSTFTLPMLLAGTLSTDRFLTLLLVLLGVLALVISSAGVYGVLSYWVNQSRREIGVRMAFGASVHAVIGYVMRRGLALTSAGVLLGLGLSVALGRFLSRFLFGVGSTDAIAIVAGVGVLVVSAGLAMWMPAWRAAHLDPMRSLRTE